MSADKKTWSDEVHAARAQAAGPQPVTPIVAVAGTLAHPVESAHGTAVREAEGLIEDTQRLLRCLNEDGFAATFGGNNFLAQAQALREALTELDVSRYAFGAAVAAQKKAGKG